jgi:F0F1-type ATP synthase assembly protein I
VNLFAQQGNSSVKFIPTPKPMTPVDKGISQGAELAAGVLVFFLIGLGIDTWLGTVPVFMIALTVFGVVGYFVRMYYAYNSVMSKLEKERADKSRGDHA